MTMFGVNMKSVKAVTTLALCLCVVNVKAVEFKFDYSDDQYRQWVKDNFNDENSGGALFVDDTRQELELWKHRVYKPTLIAASAQEFWSDLHSFHEEHWGTIKQAWKKIGPINNGWTKKDNESAKADDNNYYCQDKTCVTSDEHYQIQKDYGGVPRSVGRQVFPGQLFKDWPHHCRKCGNVFCKHCSKKKLLFQVGNATKKSIKEERVCDGCYWRNPYQRKPESRRRLASDSTSPPIRRLEQLIRNQQ